MNQVCSIHLEVWLSAFYLDPLALAYAACFTIFGNTQSRRTGPYDWIIFTALSFSSGTSLPHFWQQLCLFLWNQSAIPLRVGCPVKSCNWAHWHLITKLNRCSNQFSWSNLTLVWHFSLHNTASHWCLAFKLTTTMSPNLTLLRVLSQSAVSLEERVDLLVALLLLLLATIRPGWSKTRRSLNAHNCKNLTGNVSYLVFLYLVARHQLVHRWFGSRRSLSRVSVPRCHSYVSTEAIFKVSSL